MKRSVLALSLLLFIGCSAVRRPAAANVPSAVREDQKLDATQPNERPPYSAESETQEMRTAFSILQELRPADNDVCAQFQRYQSAKWLQEHASIVARGFLNPPNSDFILEHGWAIRSLKVVEEKSLIWAEKFAVRSGESYDWDVTSPFALGNGGYGASNDVGFSPGWIALMISEIVHENPEPILDSDLPDYYESRKVILKQVREWIGDWRTKNQENFGWFAKYWSNKAIEDYDFKPYELVSSPEELGRFLFAE